MLRMAYVAAMSLVTLAYAGDVPALAFAGVDSCYKECYLDVGNGLTLAYKRACRKRCEATPHYKCEKKCWKTFANEIKKARACVSRCP
jgi:hypothetical protein